MYFFSEKMEAMDQEETREERLGRRVMEKLWELTIARGLAYTTASQLQQKTKKSAGLQSAKALEPFLMQLQESNCIEITEEKRGKRLLYVSPYFQKPKKGG